MRYFLLRPAELGQGVHEAEGGEQGRDHRVLLRQPQPRQDRQEQVRTVWLQVQEGGVLIAWNQAAVLFYFWPRIPLEIYSLAFADTCVLFDSETFLQCDPQLFLFLTIPIP